MRLRKITDSRKPTTYAEACPVAHALELVGERWALLVIRELMLGPRRFSDLRAALPALSANILTVRLRGLEGAGVVHRTRLAPPAASQVYELTAPGYALRPALLELGRWGARSPARDPSARITAVSVLLALCAMFRPERARGLHLEVGFDFGPERFAAVVSAGSIRVGRGQATAPDLTVSGSPERVAAIVLGPERPGGSAVAGVAGDPRLAQQFFELFEAAAEPGSRGRG